MYILYHIPRNAIKKTKMKKYLSMWTYICSRMAIFNRGYIILLDIEMAEFGIEPGLVCASSPSWSLRHDGLRILHKIYERKLSGEAI